jgi:UDP-4-amino-4,6-dideoxy-N-acetyl-beta-L-altrosamine N-acetyltransferase
MKDVKLKPIERDDLEMVRKWRNSPEVGQYMYTDGLITPEQQELWFERLQNDDSKVVWIIEYESKALGVASLSNINKTFSSCYWAFYLGEMSVRGGGIGAKVEFNVLTYVFDVLKLNKLRCEVFTFNEKVIKMHEKFGFRREAYYREHCFKNKEFKDVVGLAILRNEWLQMKAVLKSKIYGE